MSTTKAPAAPSGRICEKMLIDITQWILEIAGTLIHTIVTMTDCKGF